VISDVSSLPKRLPMSFAREEVGFDTVEIKKYEKQMKKKV
jgi:hypothetical protein